MDNNLLITLIIIGIMILLFVIGLVFFLSLTERIDKADYQLLMQQYDEIKHLKDKDEMLELREVTMSKALRILFDFMEKEKEREMKIKTHKLNEDATIPSRVHDTDAGADCFTTEMVMFKPHEEKTIGVGVGVEIPNGYVGLLLPKSSMNRDKVDCKTGVIDSGYTGEIKAIVRNSNDEPICLPKGKAICQLVIVPCAMCDYVEEIKDDRGNGGFGSTKR